MKTCCFSGHRKLPYGQEYQGLVNSTREAILQAILEGCTHFITGGAVGFDLLCQSLVTIARDELNYPLKLSVYVPHEGQDKLFSEADKRLYRELLEIADEVKVLSGHYYNGCMQARNRKMVEDSDCCIAYLLDEKSGTGNTVRYAKEKGIAIKLVK